MNWNAYFAMMEDWKCLPAYKAEPRIDSLVGFYLKDFLSEYLGVPIVGIIPELPIRLGTVKPQHEGTNYSDRSYKVDFYALAEDGSHYLVEFKTDSGSRREKQDTYLSEAQSVGMKKLVEGILQIASVSSYKDKYGHLLNKKKMLGLLGAEGTFKGKSDKIEIIYVQPSKKGGAEKTIDFHWIAEWLIKTYPNQDFEVAFAEALIKWAGD